MKLAVRLTMQGLIRALKGRAHDLAEDVEQGQVRPKPLARPEGPRIRRGEADGIRRD